jgi:hypothetical protein
VVGSNDAYVTVAYGASDGTELWVRSYNGPGNSTDDANALGISPDGSEVFVTGNSVGSTSKYDYATVAYDASTGADLWIARYNGPDNFADVAYALGVSPDGSEVFVTGSIAGSMSDVEDYATVAYDAATGAEHWVTRYHGPSNSMDIPYDLGVSPDGSEVFVTGSSIGSTGLRDYATVAYTVG